MKSNTLCFAHTLLSVSFLITTCNASSDKNKTSAGRATAENPLSTGEHFISVNGILLHYYVAGKCPVCVVPSPGWRISVNYLYKSLTPFEKYFTMVFYDTRMSGKSTGPEDSTKYSSQDFMNERDSLRVYPGQQKVWMIGIPNCRANDAFGIALNAVAD